MPLTDHTQYNGDQELTTAFAVFPQSAVESAPSDLITFALASLIKSELSAPLGDVVISVHEVRYVSFYRLAECSL